MNIIVPIKLVPDLVEELEINADGNDLDREWLKFKVNEFDDHALEEALLLKEANGGTVTAIAIASEDIDKALFAASSKGADKVVKITGMGESFSSHEAAKALANAISQMDYDLILTGVQAVDDRDGQVGVLLAHYLHLPHVSVVTSVSDDGNGKVSIHKEYGGGIMAEFQVSLPAVMGIQAARETPRYVPVAKVRRAMKSTTIDEIPAGVIDVNAGSGINKIYKPVTEGRAEMLEGSIEEITNKLVNIVKGI